MRSNRMISSSTSVLNHVTGGVLAGVGRAENSLTKKRDARRQLRSVQSELTKREPAGLGQCVAEAFTSRSPSAQARYSRAPRADRGHRAGPAAAPAVLAWVFARGGRPGGGTAACAAGTLGPHAHDRSQNDSTFSRR